MTSGEISEKPQATVSTGDQWVAFPGGELEGKRPNTACPTCREAGPQGFAGGVSRRPLCFQCYRAGIERERALTAAAELHTASSERYQSLLPFEPVNRPRLEMLKAERSVARAIFSSSPTGALNDRRRRALLAARHALQPIISGGRSGHRGTSEDRAREIAAAIRAAELQLPESWLPFVVCG
jgi:hypothetical protein